jgi:hypothetical protein
MCDETKFVGLLSLQIDQILQNTRETLHLTLRSGTPPSLFKSQVDYKGDNCCYLKPTDSAVINVKSQSTGKTNDDVFVSTRAKKDQMKYVHYRIS